MNKTTNLINKLFIVLNMADIQTRIKEEKTNQSFANKIQNAVIWAFTHDIDHKDIANVLMTEIVKLDVDIFDYIDYESIEERVREQMADSRSI